MTETEKNCIAHRIERILLDNGFIHLYGIYTRGDIDVEIEKTYGLRDVWIGMRKANVRERDSWDSLAQVPYCPDGTDQHRPYLTPGTIIRCVMDIVECEVGNEA